LRLSGGLFRQRIQRERHCFLELRIVAFAHCLRVLLHRIIRFDAVVLHVPLTLGGNRGT